MNGFPEAKKICTNCGQFLIKRSTLNQTPPDLFVNKPSSNQFLVSVFKLKVSLKTIFTITFFNLDKCRDCEHSAFSADNQTEIQLNLNESKTIASFQELVAAYTKAEVLVASLDKDGKVDGYKCDR
jgi:hypothetical protein